MTDHDDMKLNGEEQTVGDEILAAGAKLDQETGQGMENIGLETAGEALQEDALEEGAEHGDTEDRADMAADQMEHEAKDL